ncbi:zinc finger MYM-type 1-like [Paramuricea clavata]|uniref:Zinc finger MYM-type 1-like n=1 Tax=Paramuricea clavata TaxID=317549 RepID=A0A7D9ECN1_PARCT|nr:zinc finger MYM-type 1-like [Paramuricea clavata]
MKSFQTKKLLLDMVEVEDGTAKGIYAAVKQSFSDLHVPVNNIIGYSSDTCNVMFGEYNSISQLLRAKFPDVVTVKCSCHLIHLVSSQAALQLPKGLEDLCRDVFAHFRRSSKRQDTYKEFQEFFKVEPHKLLAPAQMRWLSLEACVNRILLKEEVEGLIRSISSDFMEVPYIKATNPKDIDPSNVGFQLPLDKTYVRLAATTTLHEIKEVTGEDHADVHNFLMNCRNFLIESIKQILQKFDIEAEIHDVVQCTLPRNAAAHVPPSPTEVVKKLPYLNTVLATKKLDGEWREHVFEEKLTPDLKWEEYWLVIKDAKISSGEPKYPNLTRFVELVSSSPFSNAAVERMFSLLKRIKTDDRTRLKSSSLVSLLHCKLAMKNGNYTAAGLKPTKQVLDLISEMKSNATDG